jgi:hypothetical protein
LATHQLVGEVHAPTNGEVPNIETDEVGELLAREVVAENSVETEFAVFLRESVILAAPAIGPSNE